MNCGNFCLDDRITKEARSERINNNLRLNINPSEFYEMSKIPLNMQGMDTDGSQYWLVKQTPKTDRLFDFSPDQTNKPKLKRKKSNDIFSLSFDEEKEDQQSESLSQNNQKYEGETKKGKRHGFGKMTYLDTSVYLGYWSKGNRSGEGTLTNSNGYKYTGTWLQDKEDGQGEINYPGGTHYKGEFLRGELHGQGLMKFSNGNQYEGEFVKGKIQGEGKMTYFKTKAVYEGKFKNDKREGFGTYRHPKLGIYDGPWKNDQKHGTGQVRKDEAVMLMEFKKGKVILSSQ